MFADDAAIFSQICRVGGGTRQSFFVRMRGTQVEQLSEEQSRATENLGKM